MKRTGRIGPDKRFYVGSSEIANRRSDWAVSTESEAIEKAKLKCQESGERQIVVKIIAVIETTKPPVKVIKLRG